MMRTYVPKADEIDRKWVVVDASDKVLGRLATEVSRILRGKNKPEYTPHLDTGDFVVVINAENVRLTGNKEEQKNYYRHSGRPGSLHTTSLKAMREKSPERVIRHAVKGMLPKNRLGRKLLKKLKVYAGSEHPHQAQQPTELTL